MRRFLFSHPLSLEHRPPPGHPERPERLNAFLRGLDDLGFQRREAPLADDATVLRVHQPEHLALLRRAHELTGVHGTVALDPDTIMSSASLESALRAAGSGCAAVESVLGNPASVAMCAVRPPGHHAEPNRPMGFCLLNSIAIAALHALEACGLQRVAVLDIDVHHGNGTQAAAEREPRLFFASVHQAPLYPGTGQAEERGAHDNIRNAPLPPGTQGPAWRQAVAALLSEIEAFAPQLLLVSAGFDGHARDPLAHFSLLDADFAWAGAAIRASATRLCGGAVVAMLEGGYDLPALESAGRAFAAALSGADVTRAP